MGKVFFINNSEFPCSNIVDNIENINISMNWQKIENHPIFSQKDK